MGQTEIILFIILTSVIVSIFFTGIILFLLQYKKRKAEHLYEMKTKDERHSRELLSAQLEIQQQTMEHIGREIHDNVGQKLTLASLYTQQLDYEGKYLEIKDRIISISQIINESLQELRSLSKGLTNNYIEQTPLEDLLLNECNRVNTSGKCIAIAELNGPVKTASAVKMIVVRIVQEFIQNSLKHAECTTIKLVMKQDLSGLSVSIRDNGVGFDIDFIQEKPGIGIQNMKRRAEMISAGFEIKSMPGKGTSLYLFIPQKATAMLP